MNKKEIYTVEINLDADFASTCAYHVDSFENTKNLNLTRIGEDTNGAHWVVVGLAYSMEEGFEKAEKLQKELCRIHNRTPYGIEDLL